MSYPRKKDKAVSVSFTNWVLGGSLVSMPSSDSARSLQRLNSKKVVIELDSVCTHFSTRLFRRNDTQIES